MDRRLCALCRHTPTRACIRPRKIRGTFLFARAHTNRGRSTRKELQSPFLGVAFRGFGISCISFGFRRGERNEKATKPETEANLKQAKERRMRGSMRR